MSQEFLIVWTHPHYGEQVERFESRADAEAALTRFVADYPWNTYTLAAVERTLAGVGAPPAPTHKIVGHDGAGGVVLQEIAGGGVQGWPAAGGGAGARRGWPHEGGGGA